MKKKLLFFVATLQAAILLGVMAFVQVPRALTANSATGACTASGLTQEQCRQCSSAGMTLEECLAQQAQLQPSTLEDTEEGAAPGGVPSVPNIPAPSMGC